MITGKKYYTLMTRKCLFLYSGQKDCLEKLICFCKKQPCVKVDLLYIKSIGFRNNDEIPLKSALYISKHFNNIENLISTNGSAIQLELIRRFACDFGIDMKIFIFCLMCQFEINYIYSKFAKKNNYDSMMSNTTMFGEAYSDILKLPFDYFCGFCYPNPDVRLDHFDENIVRNTLEYNNVFSRCQFSYLHNMKNFPVCHIDKLKKILVKFINEFNFNDLKIKIYKLISNNKK